MITMETRIDVKGICGKDVADFMLRCTDADYRRWWQGTHLAFHTVKRYPNEIGNLVYFDEYVGRRRLKFWGVITAYVPARKIVWQMKAIFRLPGWLVLDFEDRQEGLRITHSVLVGFCGAGASLDPILKIYFSRAFEKELAEHAQTEFDRLAALLGA
jgi:hypothetical protein